MKNILNFTSLATVLLILTACGGMPLTHETTPGSALPDMSFNYCEERDSIGRCKQWSSPSSICINPKGINEPDPVVECNHIKNGKYIAPEGGEKIRSTNIFGG